MTLTYSKATLRQSFVLLLSKLSAVTVFRMTQIPWTVRTSNSDDSPIARLALVLEDGANVNVETLGQYLDNKYC